MKNPRKPETKGPRVENYRLKEIGQKRCGTCEQVKPLTEFNCRNKVRNWWKTWCRDCESAHFKVHYQKHASAMRERGKAYYRTHYLKYRDLIFQVLGNVCACCGEDEPLFLTVDHINGDGKHQKTKTGQRWGGWSVWRTIRAEAEPKKRFRILCFNCNCGRERSADKVCPHQSQERKLRVVS